MRTPLRELTLAEWHRTSEERLTGAQLSEDTDYIMHSVLEGPMPLYEAGILYVRLDRIRPYYGHYAIRGSLLAEDNSDVAPLMGTLGSNNFFLPQNLDRTIGALYSDELHREIGHISTSFFLDASKAPTGYFEEPRILHEHVTPPSHTVVIQ